MNTDKFKVWDNDEKRFLSKPVLIDQDGDVFGLAYSGQIVYYDGDLKIVHSTGLLDKNGTEIYEGDILKRGDFPDEQPRYIVRFGKFTDSHYMYYEQEYIGWYVDGVDDQDKYRNPLTYIVDMLDGIVCGNIYEHPHLLSGDSP